jgi:Domain of unknown function (DUF397)
MVGEVDPNELPWRSSSACNGTACVEVAFSGDVVYVRHSGDGPGGSFLRFSLSEWNAFLAGVGSGEFSFG